MEAGENVPQCDVSLGRILLGNWVEERQVAHIDSSNKTIKELHVGGHSGVLTQTGDSFNGITTCTDSYRKPQTTTVRKVGKRRELLEKELYEKISSEMHEKMNQPPPPIDFMSTTKQDYKREYQPIEKQTTREHNVNTDEPMTFWSQNIQNIDGVTEVKSEKSPFKKNTAFSTPIHEYKDASKPGEQWNF